MTPKWLQIAYKYLKEREVAGKAHNPHVLRWWQSIGAKIRDDETPWCAAYVGGVLEESGIVSSKSAAARSYLKWGITCPPTLGCIVVFWRGKPDGWSGHVGFVVGRDKFGNLMVLGGNQADAVNIKPFNTSRVLGYRWPRNIPLTSRAGFLTLPVLESDGKQSQNEA